MKGVVRYKKRGQKYEIKFSGNMENLKNMLLKHMQGNPVYIDRSTGNVIKLSDFTETS